MRKRAGGAIGVFSSGDSIMSSVKSRRAAILSGLVVACAGGVASAQYSLEALPTAIAPGGGFSGLTAIARGISGNGQVIVGSTNQLSDERALVWRRENGTWTRSFLPMALGNDNRDSGRALTVSYDGSTIVGSTGRLTGTETRSNRGVPAIWRNANTGSPTLTMPFAINSGLRGVATGVSSNGQAVAMWTASALDPNEGSRLARLDGDTVTYLTAGGPSPAFNVASATVPASSTMSSDGSVLAGDLALGAGSAGYTFGPSGLQTLPGLAGSAIYAKVGAISGDGRVVGGTFGNQIVSNSVGPGALWRDGVRQSITPAPGVSLINCYITGLSTNGGMGVGASGGGLDPINNFNTPPAISPSIFALLLQGNTAYNLKSVLIENGVSIPSNTYLHYATAITPDGRTITGVGTRQIGTTNQREFFSYVATIPTPGAATSIGLGMLLLAARRRR
jgi:uncharacterized membrane protein